LTRTHAHAVRLDALREPRHAGPRSVQLGGFGGVIRQPTLSSFLRHAGAV
jgi:hypothetical protein